MEHAAVPEHVREERLRRWIEEYSQAILRVCFLYLSDRGQAEDAVQDTFFKAWRHMADYERRAVQNDKAWLMRIAVNTCKDYRRAAWFRHTDFRQALDALPPGTAGVMESDDRTLALCVGQLADKYRQVVILYYYQRLTLSETAEALGIPLSTVQRRLKKAETLLREQWLGGETDERQPG